MLLIISCSSIYGYASETVSQSHEVTLSLNIKKPTCVLSTVDKKINFGEWDKAAIMAEQPEVSATFSFSDCADVDSLDIQFTGNYIDANSNQLNIATGDYSASGVAIKILDASSNEVNLSQTTKFTTTGTDKYDLQLRARLVPIKQDITTITPGDIKSAVTLVINYK
ncbi:TPA: type 1 fimbrial protein [Escherichia coli]|nr:type 1 fimbrial protein [Escherichia coli]